MKVYQIIKQNKNYWKRKKQTKQKKFHFLLKNDLFNGRGQKIVPIHFYNYIYWDTFLTKFYTFCLHCAIDLYFHKILLHYSIVSYSILFFRKIPRKKPVNFSCFETVIRRRFFLWIFSKNFPKTIKTPFSKRNNQDKSAVGLVYLKKNLLKSKYLLPQSQ